MQESISNDVEGSTPARRIRRQYTREFKAGLVAQCEHGDKSIAQVAAEHQINANLLHKWKRQLNGVDSQAMLPVKVSAEQAPSGSGYIEVEHGNTTIRFYGSVDRHSTLAVVEAFR